MVLRMASPTSRSGSTFTQFKQRIPTDVRAKAAGLVISVPVGEGIASITIGPTTQVIQFSLRTREPKEAKARQAVALAYLEGVWQSLRNGPRRLSQKQVVALSGEAYREFIARQDDDPGQPERWEWFGGLVGHAGDALFPMPPPSEIIARGGYTPEGWANTADKQARLQESIRKLVDGEAALSVVVYNPVTPPAS